MYYVHVHVHVHVHLHIHDVHVLILVHVRISYMHMLILVHVHVQGILNINHNPEASDNRSTYIAASGAQTSVNHVQTTLLFTL